MNIIESFLFSPPTKRQSFWKKLFNILIVVVLARLWADAMHNFFNYMNRWAPFDPPVEPDITPPMYYTFFWTCIVTPIWEELRWRWFPIRIARQFGKEFVFPACVIASISFGLAHGEELQSLLMQGVGGMLFCILYIKNKYSYPSTVFAHFLYNSSLVFNIFT